MKTLILLAFGLFMLGGFGQAMASDLDPLESQTINGTWKFNSIECESGKFTTGGKQVRKAVKNGQVDAVARIKNSQAIFESRMWRNSEKKGGYCRTVASQRWDLVGSGSLKSKRVVINRSGSNCRGKTKIKKPTESNFIVLGNTLKLYLRDNVDFSTGNLRSSKQTCTAGPVTLTYKRLVR